MSDLAHRKTDLKLEEMEKRLSAIYSRAGKEIQQTADEYFSKFAKQDEAKRNKIRYTTTDPESGEAPAKSIEDLAREVIRGEWGNGDEREKRLTAAGYDYDAVQTRVNTLLG